MYGLFFREFRRGFHATGAILSFFETMAVRTARSLVSGRSDRRRLQGIGWLLGRLLQRHEIGRDSIWSNVPPAWGHPIRYQEHGGDRPDVANNEGT